MALPAVTANSPVTGSIAWGAFTIQYQGVGYAIPAGNTSQRWVWWRYNTGGSTTAIEAGPDIPSNLTDDDLVLLGNKNGNPLRVQSTSYIDGELLVDGTIFAPALATDSVTSQAIKAGEVGADKVSADVMVVNDFYAKLGIQVQVPGGLAGIRMDQNGFLQLDANGAARVNFPSDPAVPNLIRSELVTEGITAQGRVALRGVDNEVSRNSAIVLQTGTTPPANSPSIALVYDTVDANFDVTGTGGNNSPSGLTRVGTSWYWMAGFTLRRRTDAGVYSSQVLPFPTTNPDDPIATSVGAPVLIGTVWHVPARDSGGWTGSSNRTKSVFMFDSTSFAYLGKWALPGSGAGVNDSEAYLAVATDGTDAYTAWYQSSSNTEKIVRVTNPNTSSRAVAQTWTMPAYSGSVNSRTNLMVGNFDFGSRRFIMSQLTDMRVYDPTAGTVTTATEGWVTSNAQGIAWDGTRFWMQRPGRLFRTSTNKTGRTITVAYTWYDSDNSGDGIRYETLLSPIVSITQPARQGMTITTPPPADDGGINSPDSARLYVGVTTSTLRLQPLAGSATSSFLVTATYLDVDPSTGALPGVSPLFPNGTAALIRSAGNTLVMRGDGTMDVPTPVTSVNPANKGYVDTRTAVAHANRYLVAQYTQASGSYAIVKLDGSSVAETGMTWASATNKWTIVTPGIYQCNAAFRVGGIGVRACRIMLNGNSQVEAALGGGSNAAEETSQVSRAIRLAAGDVIWLEGLHFVGGSATVYANKNTFMDITRISS